MKILTLYNQSEEKTRKGHMTPPGQWRIWRPFEHINGLHGIEVTRANELMDGTPQDARTEADLQKRFQELNEFDAVWSSYYTNPAVYSFARAVQQLGTVKFIIDVDDNLYKLNAANPMRLTNRKTKSDLKTIVDSHPVLVTTNDDLRDVLNDHRAVAPAHFPPESVFVIPNHISEADYLVPDFDNGDTVRIGWVGGSSHYGDLHHTGCVQAAKKVLKRNKNVEFVSVGMQIDEWMPKGQFTMRWGVKELQNWLELFQLLKFDIFLAPLTQEPFNICKSNIKWQEAAMMGAAFVGTNIGPYARTVAHGDDGILVDDNRHWYDSLSELVHNVELRKKLAHNARERVRRDWTIESQKDKVAKKVIEVIEYAKS